MSFKRGNKVLSLAFGLGEIEADYWYGNPTAVYRWGVYFYELNGENCYQAFTDNGQYSREGRDFEYDIIPYDKAYFSSLIQETRKKYLKETE